MVGKARMLRVVATQPDERRRKLMSETSNGGSGTMRVWKRNAEPGSLATQFFYLIRFIVGH